VHRIHYRFGLVLALLVVTTVVAVIVSNLGPAQRATERAD
jgi:hypothetical protein